ncbi:ETS domain-containing protein Elk-4-like [Terrapene carolina triunguis]|uniref:ETS domain-containing protein Elk-4-like n=1 Tax=Terrapene triunguis TaxID=2587831 RepID=UPI000E77C465|nr:ETS domain-containing protein Elk-4-like [Terrapene carolina triunguis]
MSVLRETFTPSQNIIKKVNGQKFVYKFVSYPEILNIAPLMVGRIEGDPVMAGFAEVSSAPKDLENGVKEKSQTCAKSSSRNDYIHSGLYSSFTLNSLNSSGVKLFRSVKIENPAEKLVEKKPAQDLTPSVIKFVTMPSKRPAVAPLASTLPTESEETLQTLETLVPPKLTPTEAPAPLPNFTTTFTSTPPASSISPTLEVPSTPPSPPLSSNPDLDIDTDIESVASQQLEQSQNPQHLSPEAREHDLSVLEKDLANHVSRAKKPKGLELAPTLVITGSDPSPLGILSPSLPTASLTPAFFSQTPILLTDEWYLSHSLILKSEVYQYKDPDNQILICVSNNDVSMRGSLSFVFLVILRDSDDSTFLLMLDHRSLLVSLSVCEDSTVVSILKNTVEVIPSSSSLRMQMNFNGQLNLDITVHNTS